MKRILTIPFVMTCLLGTVALRAQGIEVPYDTFMKLDDGQRLQRFQELTPSNRAALLREQVVRWRRYYADRLTREQDQLLADVASFIGPELFEGRKHADEAKTAFFALEQRISNAFTTEESYSLFTIHGPYLPPQ